MEVISTMAKFVILSMHGQIEYNVAATVQTHQSVAVATAAPLVLIGRELISVGYSQGTPSMLIPKAPK